MLLGVWLGCVGGVGLSLCFLLVFSLVGLGRVVLRRIGGGLGRVVRVGGLGGSSSIFDFSVWNCCGF